ncbi:MAG: hypothetical protein J5854_01230 [Clostridia bacterium]|nr:hypothetical protein [Clostridia bacterium]
MDKEILENLGQEELEEVMKSIMGKRPDRASEDSIKALFDKKTGLDSSGRERSVRRAFPLKWVAALAALARVLGAGGVIFAGEAKAYGKAAAFFAENGLSTEGLTHAEIKAVYRDITTESFTYSKTAQVIARNLQTNNVGGWELIMNDPDPVTVREYWEKMYRLYLEKAVYIPDYSDKTTLENGTGNVRVSHEYGTLKKFVGEECVWSYRSDKMRFYYGVEVSDGVLGVGVVMEDYYGPESGLGELDSRKYTPAVTKLTRDGEFVWFVTWDNGAAEEQISSVVENADGSLTVLSTERNRTASRFGLAVSTVTKDGKYAGTVFNPTETDVWVCDTVRFDGGYFAILYDNSTLKQRLIRIDADGSLANEYSYSDDGREYRLSSIALFEGKLYISAVAVDGELIRELNARAAKGETIGSEEYTEFLKKAYTAVLLVTDAGGGAPRVFYESKGSQPPYPLKVENGKLVWTVLTVVSAQYTPAYGYKGDIVIDVREYLIAPDGSVSEFESSASAADIDW